MLYVHVAQNRDAGVEQDQNIFPTFFAWRARNIGVGQFVHHADFRFAFDNGINVQIVEGCISNLTRAQRSLFNANGSGNGVFTGMRLKVADNNVAALASQLLRVFQHTIGFADTGCVAKV